MLSGSCNSATEVGQTNMHRKKYCLVKYAYTNACKRHGWEVGEGWGSGGGGGQYFINTFPFSMHFKSKNGQFYPNLGFNYISFGKVVYITVMIDH